MSADLSGPITQALQSLSAAGRAELAERLAVAFADIAARAAADEAFADDLTRELSAQPNRAAAFELIDRLGAVSTTPGPAGTRPRRTTKPPGRRGRRSPGPFDPFEAYRDGEAELRRRLSNCNVDQLKDIIAEHGMDHDRLAMKWKTSDRLIERIVDTVDTRSRKGEAFRS